MGEGGGEVKLKRSQLVFSGSLRYVRRMATATVTSKRQITLPAEMCRELRIVPGTKIDFVKNSAGETVIRPKTGDIRRLRGILKHDGPPITIEEMNEAIGEAVVEEYLRSVS